MRTDGYDQVNICFSLHRNNIQRHDIRTKFCEIRLSVLTVGMRERSYLIGIFSLSMKGSGLKMEESH